MMYATIGGVKACDGLTQSNMSALMMENIEALTSGDDSDEIAQACPNGGQKTKGEAKNKQWKEEKKADVSGNVNINGTVMSFGAEYANKTVTIYAHSVECPGSSGSCILCNAYYLQSPKS